MSYSTEFEAGKSWAADYADLLLSFDRSQVGAAIKSFFRTEMLEDIKNAEEDEIYVQICVAFVKLYQRQAIAPIRPLSAEGERQLDELLRNFNIVPGPAEEQPEELTFLESVVRDWNTLPTKDISRKRHSDPKYEAAINRAIEEGKIV
jgi:hypothetical protein